MRDRIKEIIQRLRCDHNWWPIYTNNKVGGDPIVRALRCNKCDKKVKGRRRIRRYVNRINKGTKPLKEKLFQNKK